ncbi:MAG: ribonuclease PH [bacterium]|nr:ribonuclease PH [bacterium]
MRSDGRRPDELRPLTFTRDYTEMADGSVLVALGRTRVLCTASVSDEVPRWMRGRGTGWVTAEYSMLPGSSPERVDREARRGRQSGRTQEIQRLVGRSLRAVCDLGRLGERSVTVDCDVLQADGGTRVASICGGYIALHDALSRAGLAGPHPLTDACAAVSVAVVDGRAVLDPDYREDVRADVDMNVVMTGTGGLIEVQGTAEGTPFGRPMLDELLDHAGAGIAEIVRRQGESLSAPPAERPGT